MGPKVFRMKHALRFALCALLLFSLLPCVANAQGLLSGITGYFESDYIFSSIKSTDSSGNTTKTESNAFNNRFTLNINTSIFPNLILSAGVLFEKDISLNKMDDTNTKLTSTKFNPFFNLTLVTPVYTAGIGYSRREDTEKTGGSPGTTLINEQYTAILGWKPERLPTVDVLLQRTNNFDETKDFLDTTQDYGSIASRYTYKDLDIRYLGSYTDLTDNINKLETTDLVQSGRLTYSDSFFDKRVSFSGTYNITFDQITVKETSKTSASTVSFQTFPFAGLSTVDNTLDHVTLNSNPALIDGNTTASAGIDLMSDLPVVKRQLGLDFLTPAQVNQLLVWVDREITSTVVNSFSWDIWVSDDNLTWTHWAGPVAGTFGPFLNRFEIDFPVVTPAKRYIKVVTTPLVRSVLLPPDIFVTELQAFSVKTSASVLGPSNKRTLTTTSHILETDVKTRILDVPLLYYDLSYFLSAAQTSGSPTILTWTLSNGLSLNQDLSRVFTVTARAAREDGVDQNETRSAWIYNAALTAIPLRTLRSTLVFGGRYETIKGQTDTDNSIFLNNIASLYKGIDVNLGGGVDWQTSAKGQTTQLTRVLAGANITPNPRMVLTINYTDTITNVSGGGQPSSSTNTGTVDVFASYTPFDTVRLLAGLDIASQTGTKTNVLQTYGINWSPFPQGNLQFNINYTETLMSEDNAVDKVFVPSVRWKITPKTFLTLAYLSEKSTSKIQKTDSQSFNATLQIFF